MRIKHTDIPVLRLNIAVSQGNRCRLCNVNLDAVIPCLDHDHSTGLIRGVLCGNCNGIEGKIFNLARRAKRESTEAVFLQSILAYWELYANNPREIFHPLHRTQDEKRIRRNKKAKARRSKSRA